LELVKENQKYIDIYVFFETRCYLFREEQKMALNFNVSDMRDATKSAKRVKRTSRNMLRLKRNSEIRMLVDQSTNPSDPQSPRLPSISAESYRLLSQIGVSFDLDKKNNFSLLECQEANSVLLNPNLLTAKKGSTSSRPRVVKSTFKGNNNPIHRSDSKRSAFKDTKTTNKQDNVNEVITKLAGTISRINASKESGSTLKEFRATTKTTTANRKPATQTKKNTTNRKPAKQTKKNTNRAKNK